MYAWTFVLFYLIEHCKCDTSNEVSEAYYECGPHGRFEYCINGIPGCVVGCHCYPGYYFDTESKICEPNIKLTQGYRRQYFEEPTRIPRMTFSPMANNPTPTTSNPIDAKVDSIAKDSDDLGDWLYNQFFKTIENQVINSTDDEKLTRRSGSQVAKPIPKSLRRSRKRYKSKSRSKKKRFKKKGLRRKLLRITEDDSLFDSSSESNSDESSDSSSSSDTSDEKDDDENDHGHRKILMINKKPKPPLPSFIFMPNVETPFYPPIGLPPPPILPMYPMVPVPPVGPQCTDAPTTTSTTVVETTTTSTTTTSTTAAVIEDEQHNVNIRARETTLKRNKKVQKNNGPGGKKTIVQKLRNKMKNRNKRPPPALFADNYQDPEASFFNNPEPPPGLGEFRSNMYDPGPPIEDVGFKYLSQLIHNVDLNKTKPSTPLKPKQSMNDLANLPFRRNNPSIPPIQYDAIKKMRPESKADENNNSYYSNLGRQIASLIRKVDSGGERQINIEIEQQNRDPMETMFNENRYAPRSYWERFVRSPLKFRQNYAEEMQHFKNSNENLFNLEDQVSLATAIEKSLSLQELENIANVMEITQSTNRQKSPRTVTPATSNRSYNINLLPQLNRRDNAFFEINDKKEWKSNKVVDEASPNRNIVNTLHYNIYPTHVSHNAIIFNNQINETHKNSSTATDNKNKLDFLNNLMKSPRQTALHHQVSRIVHTNVTTPRTVPPKQMITYQLNPVMLNYKSVKFVKNNHNPYQLHASYVPFHMPFLSKPIVQSIGRSSRPSYFHHELHHFDYFD